MYALSAIPIWIAKMGMMFGVLKWTSSILTSALDWVVNKFEKLLYFDFSGLFSGNPDNKTSMLNYDSSSNSFKFFPSTGSPFFILWIVFLSAGVFFMLVIFAYTIVKKMSIDEDEYNQNPVKKSISTLGASIVLIFFVPFIIFSSMSVTSTLTKALFKNDLSTTDKNSIDEYNNNFSQKLTEVANNIYDLGSNNVMEIKNGAPNALYSHDEGKLGTGKDKDQGTIFNPSLPILTPFKSTKDVLDRINYELAFLNTNNSLVFDSETALDIASLQKDTKDLTKKYFEDNVLKQKINRIAELAGTLSTKKSEKTNQEVVKLHDYLDSYHEDVLTWFEELRTLIANKDIVSMSLKSANSEINAKLNNLFKTNNSTKHTDAIVQSSSIPAGGSKSVSAVELDGMQKLVAFANIYSLTKVYISPEFLVTSADWSKTFKYPEGENLDFITGQTLMDAEQNIEKMTKGYKVSGSKHSISIQMLGYAWSEHERTTLSGVVDDIVGAGGADPMKAIIMTFVGFAFITACFAALYQLVKRLLERITKLLYLWIAGMIIVPISISQGSQSLRNWFSAVLRELLVLVGLGLGFEIWRLLTPLLFNWIGNDTAFGAIIMKGFFALGLLELVVKFSDWIQESVGASGSMSNLSSNIRGESSQVASKVKGRRTTGRELNLAHERVSNSKSKLATKWNTSKLGKALNSHGGFKGPSSGGVGGVK